MEKLISLGHDIALHFMGELCNDDDIATIVEKVLKENTLLEEEFGIKCHSVSFHQPSKVILENAINIPGLINTYNKEQLKDYFYLSDTNMTWRHEHPYEVFEKRIYPRLQLLIHPIWWTPQRIEVKEKWLRVLSHNNQTIIDHWKLRERSLSDIDLEPCYE